MNKYLISAFMMILIFMGCNESENPVQSDLEYPPDNYDKVSIIEGAWGNVWFWEGSFMPGSGNENHSIMPVVREIYIHEPTTLTMVTSESNGFYTEIRSKLVRTVRSDSSGFFQAELPPGRYSFFVKEGQKYYANRIDGEGFIMAHEIFNTQLTKVQLNIDYKASY